jgi:A/G-specific adenine glycosylase
MNRTQRIEAIRGPLLAWFQAFARDLPWRENRDPYRVWVSEIMLQQTRVETVVAYFRRFMQRFPSVQALAEAKLDELLKCWEGLGYYSRARNLHAAARKLVAEHGGKLPTTAEELLKLPGIGPYTAGAIASIAFGADEPVVDGNVKRVLCRLLAIAEDPRKPATEKKLWRLARKVIPPGQAGTFNEAMMDLGATICTARRPRCDVCPLEGLCLARRRGKQEQLPVRSPRKPAPHYDIAAGVIRRRGRMLIDRRRDEGLLGGLWELPGGKVEPGETPAEAVVREAREEVGLEVKVIEHLASVDHAYTHFRITLHVYVCDAVRGRARAIDCAAVKWIDPDQLDQYAFPTANRKVFEHLAARPDLWS